MIKFNKTKLQMIKVNKIYFLPNFQFNYSNQLNVIKFKKLYIIKKKVII